MTALLAVDIGNSNITLGLFYAETLQQCVRISSNSECSVTDYQQTLHACLSSSSWKDHPAITDAILGSVVPSLTRVLKTALQKLLGFTIFEVRVSDLKDIQICTEDPETLGIDRLINAVAAYSQYKRALILLDFGTATTLDLVSQEGNFEGGLICAGFKITAEALFERTAQITEISLSPPPALIGKNTVHCVQSGLFYGYSGMIESLLRQVHKQMNFQGDSQAQTAPLVLVTGGLASLLLPFLKALLPSDFFKLILQEHLTLQGLYRIHTQIQ